MNQLQVGFAKVNIDPMLGIFIRGYYVPRHAKGFLDHLEAGVLALACGETKILLISVDNCGIKAAVADEYRKAIQQATGIPTSQIMIAATHTHTGPALPDRPEDEAAAADSRQYMAFLQSRLVDASRQALTDLQPARMGFITGYAPERVAYIRRYKMKDGTTMTCPPINDPNIDHAIGQLDQRVHVLRFDQESGGTVVLVNYGLHADTVNGEMISADWPGWMRRTLDKTLDGVQCMFFAGAEGDVGSTHVFPCGGDMNDTEISFDNEMKSPGMARFVGRALAGTVLQVFDKVEYVDVETVAMDHRIVTVDANVPDPADLPLAHKYKALHDAGRDDEIPYTAMELTTVVAEAARMCMLENGPEVFHLELTGVKIGPVALVGIPGEPFTEIGVQIKQTEGWSVILPCALANGQEGYFPMRSAFDEGGYEARSSRYRADVAEKLVEGSRGLLRGL